MRLDCWESAGWESDRYIVLRNRVPKEGLSFVPLGREEDLSTPISSCLDSSVAARMA